MEFLHFLPNCSVIDMSTLAPIYKSMICVTKWARKKLILLWQRPINLRTDTQAQTLHLQQNLKLFNSLISMLNFFFFHGASFRSEWSSLKAFDSLQMSMHWLIQLCEGNVFRHTYKELNRGCVNQAASSQHDTLGTRVNKNIFLCAHILTTLVPFARTMFDSLGKSKTALQEKWKLKNALERYSYLGTWSWHDILPRNGM